MKIIKSLFAVTLFCHSLSTALHLNVTAITARRGNSSFECWQLSAPLQQSNQPGIVGTATTFLGDVNNMTYAVIPAGFDSGYHTVPGNQ
jgi:hypothetical protein